MNNLRTRERPFSKVFALSVCLVLILTMFASFSTRVYAIGGVSAKDVYKAGQWDSDETSDTSEPPEWSTFKDAAEASSETVHAFGPEQYQRYKNAVSIYNTFGTEAEYERAIKKLRSFSIGYNAAADELVPANNTAKGQQDLARAVDAFNSSMGSLVAEGTISGIFDTQNFNPSAGPAAAGLDTFYMIVNTIFYVVSNVVVWWFLAQTSFDMLYIMCEPLRPIIGPANSSGGGFGSQNAMGGGGGWQAYVNKAVNMLHLCSSEAAAACGGGGGGGFGQNASNSNPWWLYFKKRATVVVCVGVYLVLVSAGWWPKIISWVAGIVTRLLGTIIH